MLVFKNHGAIKWIVLVSCAVICSAAIIMTANYLQTGPGGQQVLYFPISSPMVNSLVGIGDIILALVFLFVCRCLPFKKLWIPLLIILQYAPVIYYNLSGRVPATTQYIFLDNLSIIMALIIGIVGAMNCPVGAITVDQEEHYWQIDRLGCIVCGACVEKCPKKCLTMENTYTAPTNSKTVDRVNVTPPKPKKPAPPHRSPISSNQSSGKWLGSNLDLAFNRTGEWFQTFRDHLLLWPYFSLH